MIIFVVEVFEDVVIVVIVVVYDLFGDGVENNDNVVVVVDGDWLMGWEIECYIGFFGDIKFGVGFVFIFDGLILVIEIIGS